MFICGRSGCPEKLFHRLRLIKVGVGKKGGQYNLLSSISNSPPIK